MSIVITGATSQLGRLTVSELLERGVGASDIVATGRNEAALAELADLGVRTVQADYLDPSSFDGVISEGDRVLLVSSGSLEDRVNQHSSVIDAAKAAGAAQLAYTSVLHADTSDLVLAPDHKATEQLIADSGIPHTFLRNGWYIENLAAEIPVARQTNSVIKAAGDGKISGAARADFAAAAAAVLTNDIEASRSYELTGDVAYDYNDVAGALSELLGTEIGYQAVSTDELTGILTGHAGLPPEVAGFVATLDAQTEAGLLADVTNDLSTLIGRPTTPLIDGLRPLVG